MGVLGSIPGLGRSAGGGHGSPLRYSRLENPQERGTWRAIVHGVAELDTTEQLSTAQHSFAFLECHKRKYITFCVWHNVLLTIALQQDKVATA